MSTTKLFQLILSARSLFTRRIIPNALLLIILAPTAHAAELKVMKTGLGSGTVISSTAGINCGGDCDESYGSAVSVTLTATPDAGSVFLRWEGDGAGIANPTTVTMSADRSIRAVFDLTPSIPTLIDFTPEGIQTYLTANPIVNTPARFINALPRDHKQNWILMTRSESLQTGTAQYPRLLLPNANARIVFTVGLVTHSSYPGSHPNAIEYMQWDPVEKNFRFHEIILDSIPPMGTVPARSRSVSIDDNKCSKCHSTRNVLNRSSFPGTTGIPPGIIKAKNKPNWDSYDSWGGMMPFNRDRIYQGSVEAAAFRKLLNPWTWRANESVRSIIEQLELQPPGVPAAHVITRTSGGANDGHINFGFDVSPPVLTEPAPSDTGSAITTSYSFDGQAGTGAATSVIRGGSFVTLHHSNIPTSDEGRGVRFFDALGGAPGVPGNVNRERIVDELINHHFATGSMPIDIRPIALAISRGLVSVNAGMNTVVGTPPLMIDLGFFDARNGMRINDIVNDTRIRTQSVPLRKADIQKKNLDRTVDVYLLSSVLGGPANGLIQEYGGATSGAMDISMGRLRQEVFRRPNDLGSPDSTVMGGIYVDRELYTANTEKVALFRYFLEPLGVSVDKWSMGVRGRSRTYSFADVFGTYLDHFRVELSASLGNPTDIQVIAAVNSTLSSLPPVNAVPTYTDVQRIFNKSCIECHGGLGYPPYQNYGTSLDFSEDENPPVMVPPMVSPRLARSYEKAVASTTTDPNTSFLYNKITRVSEACPFGLMPCGGPALSKVDIETIRRWIVGPPSRPSTVGDPHIKTVDGINYDFQSAGEFVLLRDEYVEIQARQTAVETDVPVGPNPHTGLTSCVSVNSAVAVRVGRHRITYQPNISGRPDPEGLQLRVDGKLMKMNAHGIPLASGGRIMQTIAPGGIQIEGPGGTVIVITPGWWEHYQLWYLNIDVRQIRATQGLMGTIAPGNWLPALPDGTLLGPMPDDLQQRHDVLYGKFGNAWRVNDVTSLFDYAPGTSTKNFIIESWPGGNSDQACTLPPQPGAPQTKPPEKALTLVEAEECCSGIIDKDRRSNCVKDVMATGNRGFSKTYLLADQIDRNKYPTAPVLVFPEENKVAIVKPATFTWNQAIDADGDPLTYTHYVWPVDETPNHNHANPVLIQNSPSGKSNFCFLLVGLLGCLLFTSLIFWSIKKKPCIPVIGAIAILATVALAYYFSHCGMASKIDTRLVTKTVTNTVSELKSGKAYFWKVVAEDGKGGTVESETRRFEIK